LNLQKKKETFIIENIGNNKLNISLQQIGLKEFLNINKVSFELNTRESKTITLNFFAKEDAIINSYTGKLILKTGGIEKEILISLEVKSKESFPSEKEIPKKPQYNLLIILILIILIILSVILYNSRKSEKLKKLKKHPKAKSKRK